MRTNKILILLTYFLSLKAFAGGDIAGNGGDLIVCRDSAGTITSVELLDFYEARVHKNYTLKIDPSLDFDEAMKEILGRMTHFDVYAHEQMEKAVSNFFDEALFIPGVEFVDVPDSLHIGVPKGCKIEQVAIQREPLFPGEKRFSISKDLWDLMDGPNKTGLVLHEIIFQRVIEQYEFSEDPVNSLSTRFLVGLLAADRMDVFSFKDYLKFIRRELGYYFTNIDGYLVENGVTHPQFFSNGNLKSYKTIFTEEEVFTQSDQISFVSGPYSNARFERFLSGGVSKIEFFEIPAQVIEVRGKKVLFGMEGSFDGSIDAYFFEDENLKKVIVRLSSLSLKVIHPYTDAEDDLSCGNI